MVLMRICFIYDAVYPWQIGGVEKRIYELSRRLSTKYEVHIFGIKWWKGGSVIEKNGIYIHGVCKPMKLYTKSRRSIREAIYFTWKVLFPLLKEKFDLIDCQEFPYFPCFSAKVYSKFKNSTLAITWHELWDNYWYEYLGQIGFFGKIVESYTTKLADINIAVSNTTRKKLRIVGLHDVILIPNGIDLNIINKIKISNNKMLDVIFVGRLIKEKNLHILIKSINILKKEIPDIKCCIIGDGPEKSSLKKLINNLKLNKNIKIKSSIDYNNIIYFLKSSKVFVTPSTREGFGIAALEANACGLPVIAVRHERNAIKDLIIEGKTGFLCNFLEEEIANRIIVAINKNNKMKKFCINFAKKFDWDSIAKEYNKKVLRLI